MKPGEKLTKAKLASPQFKVELVQLDPRALASTIEPRQVMLNVMRHHYLRDEHQLALRAAIAVAPYIHPRLSSLEVSGNGAAAPAGLDLKGADALEIVRRLAFVFFLAGQKDKPNGVGAANSGPVVISPKTA